MTIDCVSQFERKYVSDAKYGLGPIICPSLPPVNKEIYVYITSPLTPTTFYVSPWDNECFPNELDGLSEVLTKFLECHGDYYAFENWPRVGTICAARFIDGKWYRACVLLEPRSINNELVQNVFFIDFGNCSEVTFPNIKKLDKYFAKTPGKAALVSLRGVVPSTNSKVWLPTDMDAFQTWLDAQMSPLLAIFSIPPADHPLLLMDIIPTDTCDLLTYFYMTLNTRRITTLSEEIGLTHLKNEYQNLKEKQLIPVILHLKDELYKSVVLPPSTIPSASSLLSIESGSTVINPSTSSPLIVPDSKSLSQHPCNSVSLYFSCSESSIFVDARQSLSNIPDSLPSVKVDHDEQSLKNSRSNQEVSGRTIDDNLNSTTCLVNPGENRHIIHNSCSALPPLTGIPDKCQVLVLCCKEDTSPEVVFVRPLYLVDDYKCFQTRLNLHYGQLTPCDLRVSSALAIGQLCCIRNKDFFRGHILSPGEASSKHNVSTWNCLLIDEGIILKDISATDIFPLVSPFNTAPSFTLWCRLSAVSPLRRVNNVLGWDEPSISHFQQSLHRSDNIAEMTLATLDDTQSQNLKEPVNIFLTSSASQPLTFNEEMVLNGFAVVNSDLFSNEDYPYQLNSLSPLSDSSFTFPQFETILHIPTQLVVMDMDELQNCYRCVQAGEIIRIFISTIYTGFVFSASLCDNGMVRGNPIQLQHYWEENVNLRLQHSMVPLIATKLKEHYKNVSVIEYYYPVGALVAVNLNDTYYRAHVVCSFNLEEKYLVHLIDIGDKCVVGTADIYPLPEIFIQSYPILGKIIRLYKMTENVSFDRLTLKGERFLKALFEEQIYALVKHVGMEDDLEVILFKETPNGILDINQELLQRELVRERKCS